MKKTNKALLALMAILNVFVAYSQTYPDFLRSLAKPLFKCLPPNSILEGILPANSQLSPYMNGATDRFMDHFQFQDALTYLNNQREEPANYPDYHQFLELTATYHNRNLIPLAMINFDFYRIKEEAVESNIIYLNPFEKELQIKAGHEHSWYASQRLSYITTFYPVTEQDTVWYILPSSLCFTNLPLSQSFWIHANDSRGWFSATLDQPFYAINSIPGFEMRIKISFSNPNSGLENGKEIPIRNFRSPLFQKKGEFADVVLMAKSMQVSNACYTNYNKEINEAKISILYKNAFLGLVKPVIFVEGYDIDNNPFDNRFGDVNFGTLLSGISLNEKGESVKQNLKDLPVLMNALRSRGFDIVFVDFQQGSGDLIKNGNALIKIIQWVNENKKSEEELIVMGASMGGLLARYALAKMEKNGCRHCAKLCVTFDSPHKGANVPLGMQGLLEFFAKHKGTDDNGSPTEVLGFYHLGLGSMGAQQMLQKNIYPGADAIRAQWVSILKELGHPKNCRNVALANGNPNGQNFQFSGGDLLFNWAYNRALTTVAFAEIFANSNCPPNCDKVVFRGFLPRGASPVGKWANAMWGLHYTFEEKIMHGYESNKHWDNAPGGAGDWLQALTSLSVWNSFKDSKKPQIPNGSDFCFVPVASALDLEGDLLNFNVSSQFPSILSRKEPQSFHPFDAIHLNAFNENQAHVFVDTRSVVNPLLGEQNNVGFILEQVDLLESPAALQLPSVNGSQYNLATASNPKIVQRIPLLTINKEGVFYLNGKMKRNFGSSDDWSIREGDSMFYQTTECLNRVIINEGGQFVMGNNNVEDLGNNKATLTCRKGFVMEINNGGVLHINNHSKLILEAGAKLIYHKGARILLDGEYADLEVIGSIEVEAGAVLSFERLSASKGGRLILARSEANKGYPIYSNASNTSFRYSGNSMINDEFLLVRGGPVYLLPLGSLEISNCKIICESEGSIVCRGANANLHHLVIAAKNNARNTSGLKVINDINHLKISLSNMSFENLKVGLILENNPTDVNTPDIPLQFVNFRNCELGLKSNLNGLQLNHCGFHGCKTGVEAVNLYKNASLLNSHFSENRSAISLQTKVGIPIQIENNLFENNHTGLISSDKAIINMRCNNFLKNGRAIHTEGELNLSASRQVEGSYGGYNTFYNNGVSIELNEAEIYLKQGHNNFINQNPEKHRFLEGGIKNSSSCLNGFEIEAEDNFWFPFPESGNLSQAGSEFYQISVTDFTGSRNEVTLSGNLQNKLNALCAMLPEGVDLINQSEGELIHKWTAREEKFAVSNLYPNPAGEKVTLVIYTLETTPIQYEIWDARGRLIMQDEDNWVYKGTNIKYLELTSLSSGKYTLIVKQNKSKCSKELLMN